MNNKTVLTIAWMCIFAILFPVFSTFAEELESTNFKLVGVTTQGGGITESTNYSTLLTVNETVTNPAIYSTSYKVYADPAYAFRPEVTALACFETTTDGYSNCTTGPTELSSGGMVALCGEGADLFYYFLGKTVSDSKLQKKIAKYEKREFLKNVKDLLERTPVKALAFIKTVGIIAVPSLILIGKYQSLKPKRFILWTTIICLIKDLTILLSGYFLGITTETFLAGYGIYRIVGIVLSVIVLFYLFLQLNKKKVEEITLKILKRI